MNRIFFGALLLGASASQAQTQYIGFKAGMGTTSLTPSSTFLVNRHANTGFLAGLTYDYTLGKHFQLGAELLYQQRGFGVDLIFTTPQSPAGFDKGESNYRLHYIALPLKAGYRIGTKVYGFANIGIVPGLLPVATNTVNVPLPQIESTGNVPEKSTFDLSGMAELGGGFQFRKRFQVYASASYQQSFVSCFPSGSNFNTSSYLMMMTGNLGFKYKLGK